MGNMLPAHTATLGLSSAAFFLEISLWSKLSNVFIFNLGSQGRDSYHSLINTNIKYLAILCCFCLCVYIHAS